MPIEKVFILNGQVSSDVKSIKKKGEHTLVKFKNEREFTYLTSNVHGYNYSYTLQGDFRYREKVQAKRGQKEINAVRIAHVVHCYGNAFNREIVYGIEKSNGYTYYALASTCSLDKSVKGEANKMLSYLNELAGISSMEDEKGKKISLADKYERCAYVFSNTILAKYLLPEKQTTSTAPVAPFLIFPFGCNASQWEATKNAIQNDVSIIQGPPGTGKTQTILNIMANLLLDGKTIQMVSCFNSAVDNVSEKLQKYGYGFLLATLGKSDNKDSFWENRDMFYPNMSSWMRTKERQAELKNIISEISVSLPKYFQACERRAELKELLVSFNAQEKKLEPKKNIVPPRRKVASKKLYRLLFLLDERMNKGGSLPLKAKFLLFVYGFPKGNRTREDIETAARTTYKKELESEQRDLEAWCKDFEPKYKQYISLSSEYFNAKLYDRFGTKPYRPSLSEKTCYEDADAFLSEYPIVTSTLFSATSNIGPAYCFDYLIVDEASQADIPSGALALNSARSAVIVGDDKQLPNVVKGADKEKSAALEKKYGVREEYVHHKHSFLTSMLSVFPSAPITMLREHYRCEARIIGFCNQRFYGGMLVPMVPRSSETSMSVILAPPGNHARGRSNQRQAELTAKEVEKILKTYKEVGVIVPYNAQAELIKNELRNIPGAESVAVSTVHKFQGREEDAIILCSVDNEIGEFVDDSHLINVAVSRAKKLFVLIANSESYPSGSNIEALVLYTKEVNGEVRDGDIRSIFDLLYAPYTEERAAFLKENEKVSEYLSENIMMSLLKSIISQPEWSHLGLLFQYPLSMLIPSGCEITAEEKTYADNSWTLCDFLLYDKVSKRPVLVIEVDGTSFHEEGSRQSERDKLKDSILEKARVKELRLRTDGSNEREKILQALTER